MLYKELTDREYLVELFNRDIVHLSAILTKNGEEPIYYGDNGVYYNTIGIAQMYSMDLVTNKTDGYRRMDVKRIFSEEDWYDFQLSLIGRLCSM